MKAHKFYDKEGVGFEIYLHEKFESIIIQIDDKEDPYQATFLQIDEDDLDDLIIILTDLKNQLSRLKKENED